MKSLVSILGCVFFLLASAQKKELPVKVIEATSQYWVSGAPGGKHGIKYSIKVYITTSDKVEFKNVWLGKENVPFDVEFFSLDIPKKVQQGDYLLLSYNQIVGEKNENLKGKRLPINYKGVALIECAVNAKTRYFIAKKMQQLPKLQGQ